MSNILRKVLGALGLALAVLLEAAILIVNAIGLTSAPEDITKLPGWFQWLLTIPWWVPGLVLPLALIAFATVVFYPGVKTAKEISALRSELRDANQKAWGFEPQFRAFSDTLQPNIEKLDSTATRLTNAYEGLRSEVANLHAVIDGLKRDVEHALVELKEFNRGELDGSASLHAAKVAEGIQRRIDDFASHEAAARAEFEQRIQNSLSELREQVNQTQAQQS